MMQAKFSSPAHAILRVVVDGKLVAELEPSEFTELTVPKGTIFHFDFESILVEDVGINASLTKTDEPVKQRRRGVPITVTTPNGRVLNFNSQIAASMKLNLPQSSISTAMKKNRPLDGYTFKPQAVTVAVVRKHRGRAIVPVYQLDVNTKAIIGRFDSLSEAAVASGISDTSIIRACATSNVVCGSCWVRA